VQRIDSMHCMSLRLLKLRLNVQEGSTTVNGYVLPECSGQDGYCKIIGTPLSVIDLVFTFIVWSLFMFYCYEFDIRSPHSQVGAPWRRNPAWTVWGSTFLSTLPSGPSSFAPRCVIRAFSSSFLLYFFCF
jgi:hypothetical protein